VIRSITVHFVIQAVVVQHDPAEPYHTDSKRSSVRIEEDRDQLQDQVSQQTPENGHRNCPTLLWSSRIRTEPRDHWQASKLYTRTYLALIRSAGNCPTTCFGHYIVHSMNCHGPQRAQHTAIFAQLECVNLFCATDLLCHILLCCMPRLILAYLFRKQNS
jgi:hypothetical protein